MIKKLISASIAFSILFGIPIATAASATTLRVVQTPTIHLYSGMSSVAASVRVAPYPRDLDGNKLTMTDFGTNPTFTVDPKVTNVEEILGFTGIIDNGDNTATLTGLSHGLASKYPYTTLGVARTHGANAILVFSNNPQLYGRLGALENDQSWYGLNTFSSTTPPRYDNVGAQSTGTYIATTSEFVSWAGLTAVANAGTVNATESVKGISELATALEQASSTILGSTGAGIVMQARYATDTPQSGCAVGYTATAGAGCSVIAQLTGKIRQTFLNLAEAFTVTGAWIFSSTANFNATTTIAASNALSNALVLNTVPYQFPSSQGANGKTLINNGSGTLSWSAPSHYSLTSNSAILNSVSTNGTSTVALGIPAGTLTASSTITATANIQCLSNVTCTYVLRDSGGTTFASCTVTGVAANTSKGLLNFMVNAQSSLSSQSGISTCFINDTTSATANASAYGGSFTAATFNTANALSLVMVVQGASGSVTQVDNFSINVTP